MYLSAPRKRGRDDEDDLEMAYQPIGKRSRSSGDHNVVSSLTSQSPTQDNYALHPFSSIPTQSHSPNSAASEAGSATDDDMDMDCSDIRPIYSASPQQSAWIHRPVPARPGITRLAGNQPSGRVPTPIVAPPVRPRPAPLQTADMSASPRRLRTYASDIVPRSIMSTLHDRLPSPVDEDEPHTPTTAAGSQLSLLSVNDMDVDDDSEAVTTPAPIDLVVRRQRQRSGAFISTPDAARKFSMGYRDNCEKCRNRVPGHVNHFLGS